MIAGTTLAAEVLKKLEIDSTDSDRWDVYGAINEAVRDILSFFPIEMLPLKTATANIVKDQYLYQFPSDYVQRRDGLVRAIINSKEARIVPATTNVSNLSLDLQPSTTFPVLWLIAERGYQLLPVPAASVTAGQVLTYVYQVPTVSAAQSCLLDPVLQNVLVYRSGKSAAANEAKKIEIMKECDLMYKQELVKFGVIDGQL